MKFIGKKDVKTIAHYLGFIMQGVGITILIPIIVALIYNENQYLCFIIPSALSLGTGTLLRKIKPKTQLGLKHSMIIASIAWLWAAFIGSLVLMLALDLIFVDAFFESMSAWTTTGLTIFPDVEILPNSILFLRSLEQWVGGLGVVTIIIGILINSGTAASRLYASEAREDRLKPSTTGTMKTIIKIYLAYTILGVILFTLAGMPIFDSVNHCFTALATGGMSTKNASIGYYNSYWIDVVSIFLMIMGATSFLAHYRAVTTKGAGLIRDVQFRAMILIIIVSTGAICLASNVIPMDSLYNVVSALSGTGTSLETSAEIAKWPSFMIVTITMLMLLGGSAGSTSGAIKMSRVITTSKSMFSKVSKVLSPTGRVMTMQLSNKTLTDVEIKESSSYIAFYLLVLFFGWIGLVFFGYEPMSSLFEIASAQGNVGLSMGITGPGTVLGAKIVMIITMWVGRLEIIPIIVILGGLLEIAKISIKKKKRYNKNNY
ncbi:MAG: TrkH family potassium uptake protein [Methanobacteriaceae archaeon]